MDRTPEVVTANVQYGGEWYSVDFEVRPHESLFLIGANDDDGNTWSGYEITPGLERKARKELS